MKKIGLLGGMSWESSAEYYRLVNELVKKELGNIHSAKSIMYSVDFGEIEKLQHDGNWEELTKIMVEACQSLERAGADLIVICTNTMHKMSGDIESSIAIPLLHIADTAGKEIEKQGLNKVALLGTKFTMEQDFYKKRINDKFGIEVIIPNIEDRETVHNIIYDELVQGIISDSSREKYKQIIEKLASEGAEAVILGCTEIPLLIKQEDSSIPVYDTMTIHAKAAVDFALEK